ncbi:MAG: hypothetical protein R3E53_14560 [Myxococcota bacterium]
MAGMNTRRRLGLVSLVAASGLCLALTAAADGGDAATPIDAVNPSARTVTIDDEVYRVPNNCRIQRESGVSVTLAELRGGARPGELKPIGDIDFVRFEAVEGRSGWSMVEMVVLDAPRE